MVIHQEIRLIMRIPGWHSERHSWREDQRCPAVLVALRRLLALVVHRPIGLVLWSGRQTLVQRPPVQGHEIPLPLALLLLPQLFTFLQSRPTLHRYIASKDNETLLTISITFT